MTEAIALIIRNARLIDADELMDIAIKDDKIVMVDKKIEAVSKEELDAGGKLTSPGFVDAHMQLHKAFMVENMKWTSRTVFEILEREKKEKCSLTLEDMKSRARRAAKMALRNGTTALRSHVYVDQMTGLTPLKALLELKNECSNWIDIQVVAFMVEFPFTTSKAGESLLRRAMSLGAEVVGGVPHADLDPEKYLDIIFKVAKDFDADIDLHVDETNDPNVLTLETYAEKTLEHGYEGRVTASHCCSLSAVSDEIAKRVIRKVRDAKMNVIANPFTNLYMWGENGKPNEVTRVRELLDAGVNVTYATDNTKDFWNPFGNADMLLAGLFLAYLKQLGGRDALTTIFKMGTSSAAKITRIIHNYGIREGGKADLMILDAESPQEAIVEQAKRLYVIKNGKIVVKNGNLVF